MTSTTVPSISIMITVEVDGSGYTAARFVDVTDVFSPAGQRAVVASAAADLAIDAMNRIAQRDIND